MQQKPMMRVHCQRGDDVDEHAFLAKDAEDRGFTRFKRRIEDRCQLRFLAGSQGRLVPPFLDLDVT